MSVGVSSVELLQTLAYHICYYEFRLLSFVDKQNDMNTCDDDDETNCVTVKCFSLFYSILLTDQSTVFTIITQVIQ